MNTIRKTAVTLVMSLACQASVRAIASTTPSSADESNAKSVSAAKVELTKEQRKLLEQLDGESIKYFIENQLDNGLILDRQSNFAALRHDQICSISATGMGLIAIALASNEQHHLLTRAEAIHKVRKALETTLTLENVHGMMPHFLDPVHLNSMTADNISTIDSSWLFAGALWAAEYLNDDELRTLANKLYDRVDWQYWSVTDTKSGAPVLVMGLDRSGQKLKAVWDRYNSEAAFMYVLAIGAKKNALPAKSWFELKPYYKDVAGTNLTGGDLGLFVFQYSNELMDLSAYPDGVVSLISEARKAPIANHEFSSRKADKFITFGQFWGLSAGDGPPNPNSKEDAYRAYAPEQEDGTAHITATLASLDMAPDLVLQNVQRAEALKEPKLHGRYGYSNINLDQKWVSHDVVGIDIGAGLFSLENVLAENVIRKTWQQVPCARVAAERLKSERGVQ